jgi:hypothetical protein
MAGLRTDDTAAESYSPLGQAHPSNPDQVGQQMPGATRRAARAVVFPEKRSKVLSAGRTASRDGRPSPVEAVGPDLAGKRPTPADRLDGASLAARVEIFLQQRVGSNPLGDDAQFVAQMAAVGLHRMADRRLAIRSSVSAS